MKKLGDVKYSKGRFSVVEILEVHLDGTIEMLGFVLTGPGADSTWMYASFEEAVAQADELYRSSRPSSSPGMGM